MTPVGFGGSERVSLNFLRNVDRNSFDISLFLLIRPWEEENIFIQKVEKENYPITKIPVAIRRSSEGRDYFRVLRCFKRIRSYMRKGDFNLLHTHGYFADILGIPAARLSRTPCISTCHGFISNDINLKLYNWIDSLALRFSNKIIAVSDDIKSSLVRSGIKESRVKVVLNAVQTDYDWETFNRNRQIKRRQSGLDESAFIVGYIGRLSEEKGLVYLIEAVSMLDLTCMPIKILVIGDGAQRRYLEHLVEVKKLQCRFVFTGFQNNIEDWLSAMDVFVLPSLTEGIPLAMLEAMSCGVPVVASAVGGVPQVIESGKNGMLVSPGKPDDIRDAIYKLYTDELLRRKLSAAARETVRLKYNVKDWVGKIESEYLKLLERV